MERTFSLELNENEVKLLIVAVRQVMNVFAIAESQSSAAGEPVTSEYEPVQDAYQQLNQKLVDVLGPVPDDKPFRIK